MPVAPHAELEIHLRRQDADSYTVVLRFSRSDSESDVQLPPQKIALARLDQQRLQTLSDDPVLYGRTLGQNLLGDEAIQKGFMQAYAVTQTLNTPLHLRLYIDPSAPELQALWWETLREPTQDIPLLTNEQILFSRYVNSFDWRPVQLRPKTQLRALVMIANPVDITQYQFAPIAVDCELQRARQSLETIQRVELASPGQARLDTLLAQLRTGIDILYLVCHGALVQGDAWLWLEDTDGNTARVSGTDLIIRLRELLILPRLIVLASCESAGAVTTAHSSENSTWVALGPRLAEAGVPAILAMQGKITMQTVEMFMPVFFKTLLQEGQIDRAVAVARGTVRQRFDSWMPVLLMRLKSGRIWYIPGFGNGQSDFEKWPMLLEAIEEGSCTPIFGMGLMESLLGNRRLIAQQWASAYHFPLSPHQCDDLSRVAQYLAVNQGPLFPRKSFRKFSIQELRKHYTTVLAELPEAASLEMIMTTLGQYFHSQSSDMPHQILARLPFAVYIITDPTDFLTQALRAVGKAPQVELCRWNTHVARLPSLYDEDPTYRPTLERPLVYQLFGNIQQPRSLVLTEDDYFNYLIGVTRNKDLIPRVVRAILADSTLLFIGFHLDDLDFRVLFHSILNQEGSERLQDYMHVAVQVAPEEGRILEPERARHYLESYFQEARISIYWGTIENFTREIRDRWQVFSGNGQI